jgi:hypothetical protein
MRVLVGGLIAGVILYFVPGLHSGPACVVAGILLACLMLQLGPRSLVEKVGAGLTAALIAWTGGPRAAAGQSLIWHLLGWTAASSALAWYLHPKSE